ncbi:MAG: winged helix-turn-helix transcriptional regulator [Pseudomonadota bacterium]
MDIRFLVKLTSRAWCLPTLSLMHDGVAGKQAALLRHTGAGRTAFGQSMENLIALELVERTPGHGHPFRPEYRLTLKGQPIAAMAAQVQHALPAPAAAPLLRRSWTLPILAVSQTPRFFSGLKDALPMITDRALSQSLKQLREADWISRHVDVGLMPPRPIYAAANAGRSIGAAARQHLR